MTAGAHAQPGPPGAAGLRWRQVFPGHRTAIRELRRWLASLLPPCPSRDDVITVAVELGTNAVIHTASGRDGLFAVEVIWHSSAVRIAVADQGAPSGPQIADDPMRESGHGLLIARKLSERTGVTGDDRGRLVWADVPWTGAGLPDPARYPDGHEAAIRDSQRLLARRHADAVTWFGRATLQWWALTGRPGVERLVAADSRTSSPGCWTRFKRWSRHGNQRWPPQTPW